MSFLSDSNEIARRLKQKRVRKNPVVGARVIVEMPEGSKMLTTDEAAKMLNRKPQTLRAWACLGGPIEPVRINARLAWRPSDVEALLNGEVL